MNAVIDERQRGGPFQSVEDFLNRVRHKDVNKKSMESLIKGGAFDSLSVERGKLLANIDEILRFSQNAKKDKAVSQNNLFGAGFAIDHLNLKTSSPASKKDKLLWEKELLGIYVSDHPLNEHVHKLTANGVKPIKELLGNSDSNNKNGNGNGNCRIAGVITKIQKIVTKNGQPMIFARLEDFNDTLEMIVFTDTLSRNPALWHENSILIAEGRLSWRDSEPKFICQGAIELI